MKKKKALLDDLLNDDGPIKEDHGGGKNSEIQERMDLLPPLALLCLGRVVAKGALNHGEEDWRKVPIREHAGRTFRHWAHWKAKGDLESLSHMACRALMALELQIIKESRNE